MLLNKNTCFTKKTFMLIWESFYIYIVHQHRNRKNPNAQSLPAGYEEDRQWSYDYLRLCVYGGDVPEIEVHRELNAFNDVIQQLTGRLFL